ncbi:MAG TPA: nucleotidyltransferase family protein [Vicinamibacterales bacterium]|nr:nucleotidyltransferase family protein [Vicinamibacterales bacterium]
MSRRTGDAIASVLGGGRVAFRAWNVTAREVIDACIAHEVTGLMVERLAGRRDWPGEIRDELTRRIAGEAAIELVRRRELARVLDAVGACGIQPILIKGAALAYTVYNAPYCRPRMDTDLLIRYTDISAVREAMSRLGYTASVLCEGEAIFCQFEMCRLDEFGVEHVCDFHWKISTQPVFANVLTYDELRQRAIDVPALGPHAVASGPMDALLLACVHPAMHHRNVERMLWMHDLHLLASSLPEADLLTFTALASEKKIARICAHALRSAQRLFHTRVPESVVRGLDRAGAEPSAEYLAAGRRWHDELRSSLRSLPSVTDRLRLLREVLFPSPSYMFGAYRLTSHRLGVVLLPALYLHRHLHGAWKICSGRK